MKDVEAIIHLDSTMEAFFEKLNTEVYEFNHHNPNWQKVEEHNRFFIAGNQNIMNDTLSARGVVFINDVLRHLGIDQTQDGQVFGWIHNGEVIDYIKIEIAYVTEEGTLGLTLNPMSVAITELAE